MFSINDYARTMSRVTFERARFHACRPLHTMRLLSLTFVVRCALSLSAHITHIIARRAPPFGILEREFITQKKKKTPGLKNFEHESAYRHCIEQTPRNFFCVPPILSLLFQNMSTSLRGIYVDKGAKKKWDITPDNVTCCID